MTSPRRQRRPPPARFSWAVVILAVTAATPARADFTVLHAFSDTDGASIPYGSVVHHDGWLYGTTAYTTSGTGDVVASGGAGGGAIYAVRPDGSGFRLVKSFTSATDGQNPFHGLTITGSSIIGVTRNGGAYGRGALFRVGLDGGNYSVLHHFTGGNGGAHPYVGPTLMGNTAYGMTFLGGTFNSGVLYGYNLTTGSFSVARHFDLSNGYPLGTLTPVNEWLYGLVSDYRRPDNYGNIFRFRPSTSTYEVVHAFAGGTQGGYPFDTLTWDGGHYLYGTTLGSPPHTGEPDLPVHLADEGVIFRYDIVANEYRVIHDFKGQVGDGAKPNSAMLVAADGSLYGIAHGTEIWGGPGYEYGTLYRLDADGGNFEVLHTFDSMADGNTPTRSLLMLDDTLYGTTVFGGTGAATLGNGTVWAYAVPEPDPTLPLLVTLAIVAVGRRVALRPASRRRGPPYAGNRS